MTLFRESRFPVMITDDSMPFGPTVVVVAVVVVAVVVGVGGAVLVGVT